MADVRGYPTGPIDAKGAFTAEIDLPPPIRPGALNTLAEAERSHFVNQPGMRHKYMPLRHNPATGALSSGGRYLFRSYENAIEYRDFLEAKVFPGEQTTFWNRPFFFNTVRFAWRVTGAHDLAPITTHDLIRFERYSVPDAHFEERLPELYGASLEAARRLDLAHELPLRGSVSEASLIALGARKVFDRTSLSLAIWLPWSAQAGGAPAIWPNSPPIPPPGVEYPAGKSNSSVGPSPLPTQARQG